MGSAVKGGCMQTWIGKTIDTKIGEHMKHWISMEALPWTSTSRKEDMEDSKGKANMVFITNHWENWYEKVISKGPKHDLGHKVLDSRKHNP